jgi:hypothetical protein
MNAKKYLKFRAEEFSLGDDVALWGKPEDMKNEFQADVTTTDLVLFTDEFSPNDEIVYHDDEQRRAGSRSQRAKIRGRRNHGNVDAVTYVRPGGVDGSSRTNVKPQGNTLYLGCFGAERVVDNGEIRPIVAASVTHTRTSTVFDLAGGLGAGIAINDGCALRSNNADESGLADGEVRFVTAVATDTITVEPPFSNMPVDHTNGSGAALDDVQFGVTYGLAFDYTTTRSFLVKDGHLSRQLVGSAVEAQTLAIDGVNPLKVTHTLGFREMVLTGSDQVKGAEGDPDFTNSEQYLDVGDARPFEVGGYVNLVKIDPSTDAISATETKAKVLGVDYVNHILRLERGGTPVDVTGPDVLSAFKDGGQAGPFDTTTAYNLDVRIDYIGWVTLDADDGGAHGAGLTAANAAINLNQQLLRKALYGFNTRGGHDINWGGVFDGTANLTMTSPLMGSQSRIEVRASATNSAHTLLMGGVVDESADWEVQVVPWHPIITGAAETGEPIHNWAGWLAWDGYRMGCTSFEITLNNNVTWLEEEKADTDLPSGFVATSPRSVEVTLAGYFYGEVPRLFYSARNDVFHKACIQVGTTQGKTVAVNLRNFKVAAPEVSGDAERRFSMSLRVFATSALEDEIQMSFH